MAEKAEGNLLPNDRPVSRSRRYNDMPWYDCQPYSKKLSYQKKLVAYIKEESLEIKTRKKYILSTAHFQRSAELYW